MTTSTVDLATVSRMRRLAKSGVARTLRDDAAISVRGMARHLGVDPGLLSRWERGIYTPGESEALRWAEALRALGAPL